MSTYTLRISAEQYELDDSDSQYNQKEYTILQEFDYPSCRIIPLESANTWFSVTIDRPERKILALRINSDQPISFKLNAGSEVSNVYDLVLRGEITGLSLKNTSGSLASVTVEMWS